MRLVLVNPWTFPATTPHFGLLCVASYLKSHMDSVDISIIESEDPLSEIQKAKPDIVGITSNSEGFSKAIDTATKLKSQSGVPVIIGGVHISALPQTLPKCFDIGVIGEGEQTMLEILKMFQRYGDFPKEELENTKGLVFHGRNGTEITKPREQIKNIDDLSFPARDLVPMEAYFKRQLNLFGVKRVVSIMTSRGCPYRCVYCGSPTHWKGVRFHSVDYVLKEINHIIDTYQADGIMFWDDLFIAPPSRLKEMAQLVKKEGINKRVTFWGYVRANLITPGTCELLKEMNVRRAIFGLETGSERILRYLKKNSVALEDNKRAVELCRNYGITTSSGFMIGTPGETVEDLEQTYKFMKRYPLDNTQIYTLTPYPGTEVWEIAKSKGLVSDHDTNWAKLRVQLKELTLTDILFKRWKNVLKDKICLSDSCRDKEYLQMVFKLQKTAYIQNFRFYLRVIPRDLSLVEAIVGLKVKGFLNKLRHCLMVS